MKFMKLPLVLVLLAAAGCQTVSPNSPEALKRAEYDRLMLHSTIANCKLVVQLNQKRVAEKKEPTRDNRCGSILKNNSMSGGMHPASLIPDLGVNGIPIPIGGLVRLAIVADRNQREKKAWEASIPAWASSSGEAGEITYRLLLTQGFKQEELEGLKTNPLFSEAVRLAGPVIKFTKENPDIVKKAQA